jgi:hypothetical protein
MLKNINNHTNNQTNNQTNTLEGFNGIKKTNAKFIFGILLLLLIVYHYN